MSRRSEIESSLRHVIADHRIEGKGKTSRNIVQPTIVRALSALGYNCVVEERTRKVYPPGVPTWRDARGLQPATARRTIDVVVCDRDDQVAALVESEEDVYNLPISTWRLGGYAVESIATDAQGNFFKSYNSIERMAVAAMAIAYPNYSSAELADHIFLLRSDDPRDHNPKSVPLFVTLVKPLDALAQRERLKHVERRCRSLGCSIIARPTEDATDAHIFPRP